MRHNIDTWWPAIEQGAEAIVVTASGCGAMVKDYGHLLADDPAYAEKAQRLSALTRDISEVIDSESWQDLPLDAAYIEASCQRVAFHPPCTLQHGQKLMGRTEKLLRQLGIWAPAHRGLSGVLRFCWYLFHFSAGSVKTLKAKKLANLHKNNPEVIATSNIGCSLHLQSATDTPVVHWIELLDKALSSAASSAT